LQAFDPGEVLNLYESAAGYGLAGLRCFSWAFFLLACATTIRKFPEKRSFYFPFGVLGSCWILAGPFLIFLIVGLLDPWVRESVVFIAFAIVAFIGHASFLWLTWPSRANKSFPYHVKTNHIGIASNNDDGADYPRHTYEPATALPDATIIIPLSRRTEEYVNTNNNNIVNGGIYNAGFVRDEYYRSHGPISVPQQCLPSQPRIHTRLPSPTHDMPSIINDRFYGKDTLNNDDDDDISDTIETESGLAKHTAETTNNRMSSFESEDSAVVAGGGGDQVIRSGGSENISRHNSANQDNDSGHLSLEATSSPNSNGTASNSLENSKSTDDLPQILKENPFKAKTANKIILDPIKLPESLAHPGVPRHLFTVKK
jgi:Rhodopsin-like GPCR transmembrane domain